TSSFTPCARTTSAPPRTLNDEPPAPPASRLSRRDDRTADRAAGLLRARGVRAIGCRRLHGAAHARRGGAARGAPERAGGERALSRGGGGGARDAAPCRSAADAVGERRGAGQHAEQRGTLSDRLSKRARSASAVRSQG